MPVIGDISHNNHRDKLVWMACSDCKTERWVKQDDARKPNFTGLCHSCCLKRRNGKLDKSPNWKGGVKFSRGYAFVMLRPDHPYFAMASKSGYIKRCRLIMAEHLGRVLTAIEEVHHEDENRSNDAIENLRLYATRSAHAEYHRLNEIRLKGLRPVNSIGQFVEGGYLAN